MELNTRDFLVKALLNEQELVRDYQQFAQTTDDQDAAKMFAKYAEEDALRANKIKDMLQDKYDKK